MSKYTRGLLAVILAVVLVLPAAAFAMLPEANARSSTGMDGPEATKIVDHDTSNHWKFWEGGYDGSKVTTQNVGRIWTDKTVQAIDDGKSDFFDYAFGDVFDIRYDVAGFQAARHRDGARCLWLNG